jgi:predicted Zn-dependent protease
VYARPALEPAAAALVVDESAARAVAALGYGGGDAAPLEYPDPLARTELPAPQERWSEYAELTRAQALARERRFADAVAALEPLSAANARNVAVLDALGEALVELAQWPRAVEVLERRAALPPERLATHRDLVRAYVALGDADKARAHTLRSLELLIASHELRGEPELARRYRELYESEVGAAGK